MKTFLKKDIRSILFVLSLTLFGFTLAYMLVFSLSDREKHAAILVLMTAALTACSVGLSIYKANKQVNRKTFLKKDIRSILFVLSLTLFGFTLAYMLVFSLPDREKLASELVLITAALTACSVGLSIYKTNLNGK